MLEYQSVLIAEAEGVLTAIENIPFFCNGKFCKEYGNGGRDVKVGCDNKDVLDVMRKGNGNVDILRERRNGNSEEELEKLEEMLSNVKEKTDGYVIEWKKIDGGSKNPAHRLCREAERLA